MPANTIDLVVKVELCGGVRSATVRSNVMAITRGCGSDGSRRQEGTIRAFTEVNSEDAEAANEHYP